MRDDMYELIIARPRWGSRWLKYPRRAKRVDAKVITRDDPDKLVAKVGMKRGAKAAGVYKNLNENLSPLRRYLERQVNRSWDKVSSVLRALRARRRVRGEQAAALQEGDRRAQARRAYAADPAALSIVMILAPSAT